MTTPSTDTLHRLIARAQQDPAFLAALLADTAATLQREGIAFPGWLKLHSLEQGQPIFALALPQAELSDEALDQVAGGFFIPYENMTRPKAEGGNQNRDW